MLVIDTKFTSFISDHIITGIT